MKKFLSILLTLALFCTLLTGCNTAPQPAETPADEPEGSLRVLIDIEVGSNVVTPLKKALNKYLETEDGYTSFTGAVKEKGCPADIELEFLPTQGDERDMALTRIRTEILAGGGPDVFVCAAGPSLVFDLNSIADGVLESTWEDPLFTFPQQAVKRNMFLCLDGYIEGFEHTEWDSLTPAVMDAGKYDGKQYLLPMAYTMPVTLFKKSDFEHVHSREMTWSEMLEASPELKAAAVLSSSIYQPVALMLLANKNKDEPAFSEEELMTYMTEKAHGAWEVRTDQSLPDYYDGYLAVGFDENLDREVFPKDEPLTMVPVYSRQGGYGAMVTSFTAVNANTRKPNAAAFVVDYLMSKECQQSVIYEYLTASKAVPVMEGLMQEEEPMPRADEFAWSMTPENYEEFCRLRDNITWAEFSTQVNVEVALLEGEMPERNPESAGSKVHDAYMRMRMELGES